MYKYISHLNSNNIKKIITKIIIYKNKILYYYTITLLYLTYFYKIIHPLLYLYINYISIFCLYFILIEDIKAIKNEFKIK